MLRKNQPPAKDTQNESYFLLKQATLVRKITIFSPNQASGREYPAFAKNTPSASKVVIFVERAFGKENRDFLTKPPTW